MRRSRINDGLLDAIIDGLAHAIAARMGGTAPSGSSGPRRSSRTARRRKGQKRSSKDLTELSSTLLGYIKSKPGQRIEQIALGLNVPTSELKLPVQKLLAGKELKTRGQRRGTHYFLA